MSPERLKQYHVALDQSGGSVAGAAALLGVDNAAVRSAIKNHPELASYTDKAQPPTEEEVMARERVKPLEIARTTKGGVMDETAAVKALEDKFRNALKRIKVDEGEIDHIVALQAIGGAHFNQLRQFHGGSMLDLFLSLRREFNKLTKDLQDGFEDPEFEKIIREDRGRIMAAMIQVGDRLDKSVEISTLVEAKKAEKTNGKKGGKPGFSPLVAVKVDGNVTVTEPKP